MAKKMNYEELFATKKALMEVVENSLRDLDYRENALLSTYVADGEEQRKDADGNLLYLDDEGNRTTEETDKPCMRTVYKDRMREVDELSTEEKAKYDAIQKIRDLLVGLV